MRKLALLLSVTLLLLTTLLPVDTAQAGRCESASSADVCYVPGNAATSNIPAAKTCVACAISEAAALPKRHESISSIYPAQTGISLTATTVSPDRRPPRT